MIFKKSDPSLLAIEKLQKHFFLKKNSNKFFFPPHLAIKKKADPNLDSNFSGSILFKSNIFGA